VHRDPIAFPNDDLDNRLLRLGNELDAVALDEAGDAYVLEIVSAGGRQQGDEPQR